MTSRTPDTTRDPHSDHDRQLLAAYAAGDASSDDRTRAEAIVRACPACALLVTDLRTIAAATRDLPPPFVNTADHRLSAGDAASAAGSPWRRILGGLGLGGWDLRPLAGALTTLGVAGLLIAVLPFMSLGSSAGAASEAAAGASDLKAVPGVTRGGDTAFGALTPAASMAGSGVPGVVYASAARTAARDSLVPEDVGTTAAPAGATTAEPAPPAAPPVAALRQETPGSPLVFLSLGFIAAGGVLFALGGNARRRR